MKTNVTLLEALTNVNKEYTTSVGVEEFLSAFELSTYDYDWSLVDSRLKAYGLVKWLCTDTHVGYDAVYLDDTLVATTSQECRKCSYKIKFVSEDAAMMVKKFLMTCFDTKEPIYTILTEEELNDHTPLTTHQHFSNNVLEKIGYYEGRRAEIMFNCVFSDESDYIKQGLKIRFFDTQEELVVRVQDFEIPMNLDFDKLNINLDELLKM